MMNILIRNHAFRYLIISFIITNLGAYFSYMLLIVLSYQNTRSTSMTMGVLLSLAIGRLLTGSFAGVIVDRKSPKKVLYITNMINALLISILFFVPSTNILLIYMLCFLLAICGSFLTPAFRKFQAQITEDEEIGSANSSLQFVQEITKILGPGLAVFVLNILPAHLQNLGYLIDGCSYIIAAAVLWLAQDPLDNKIATVETKQVQELERNKWSKELKEGLQPLKNMSILSIHLLYLFISIAIAGFDVIIIAHISLNQLPSLYVGYILSAISVGLIIATFTFRFVERLPVAIQLAGGSLGIGIFYSLLGGTSQIVLFIGIAIIMGLCNGYYNIASSTYIQRKIPFAQLGRFYGVTASFFSVVTIIGMSINGLLGSISSPGFVLIITGMFIVFVSIVSFFMISYSERQAELLE